MDKEKKYTKYITLGWWLSFALFIGQVVIISMFNLAATPIVSMIIFASFVIMSFSANYDKEYVFSPYRGISRLFKKKKN